MSEFTIDDLKRILRACAGEDDSAGLEGDILDSGFEDLGYDSLALLETASRIEHEVGVAVLDEEIGEITTPRRLLDLVNNRLVEKV
ncbi:acyl carrier protein [Sphaerisporangium perillae]|uniref:acyl carrier protein n=1 Tax=Sphaerisporangium perillae TaxID=2935860 RepID=UPI0020107B61|nr:acyl carrier protein [Sphaerisporangium perillae]